MMDIVWIILNDRRAMIGTAKAATKEDAISKWNKAYQKSREKAVDACQRKKAKS